MINSFRSLLVALSFLIPTTCMNGCSAEGAVSLTGSIGNAAMIVTEGVLVTTVTGSFDVYLELGDRASDATRVTFSAFSLVDAETGSPVLAQEHLSVVTSAEMPVVVQPGTSVTVSYQIGDQIQAGSSILPVELDKSDYATLCGAGRLKIVGTLQDSLRGPSAMALSSAPFTPAGC